MIIFSVLINYAELEIYGVLTRALDNSRAGDTLSSKPKYTLEAGLVNTIKWHKSHKKIKSSIPNYFLSIDSMLDLPH
jgi:nucleoside-diphosphate-sugar epimerase